MAPRSLEDIARRVLDALPAGLLETRSELHRNLRAGLSQALREMDLVTREEYEVQRKVLARTREKLEQLEVRATELEARLDAHAQQSSTHDGNNG